MNELVLTNAKLILSDEVIDGSLRSTDGLIESVDSGALSRPGAIDCEGDYLAPGFVDIHTDNLSR